MPYTVTLIRNWEFLRSNKQRFCNNTMLWKFWRIRINMYAFYKRIDIANFMGIFPMLAKIRIHIKMISKKNDFFHLRKTNFISMLVYFGLYFNTHTHAHDQHFPEVPSLSMVLTKFPSPMTWDALKKKIFFTVFLHVNAISGKHRSGVLSVKMLKWLDSFDILTLPPWYFTSHAVGWVFFILFPKIFTGRWNVNFFTNG